ncbi:hypothetical protein MUP59_08265 [Candidatus Bathyarchaeota archaeon]|nr:hypothetical protein [Candidatus Bathyarchaeota archaeon]
MSKKSKIGCALGIISVLVLTPVWYFLLYKILVAVQATELMWFMYWVYVPAHILAGVLSVIIQSAFEEK